MANVIKLVRDKLMGIDRIGAGTYQISFIWFARTSK